MGSQLDERIDGRGNSMMRLIDRLSSLQSMSSELIMVAMVLLTVAEVFCRSFLDVSLMFSEELEGYLLVALVYLGFTVSVRSGTLFRVEFLIRKLSEQGREVLELVFDFVSFLFAALLLWQMVRLCISSYEQHVEAATILATPLYIPQIVMVVGTASLTLTLLAAFATRLIALVEKRHA